jgi:hypothetical protein
MENRSAGQDRLIIRVVTFEAIKSANTTLQPP